MSSMIEAYCMVATVGESSNLRSTGVTLTYFQPALVLIEYFLTLSDEIQFFWRRKLTGAVALFLTNRYLTLGYLLFSLGASFSPQSDTVRLRDSVPSTIISLLTEVCCP